VSPRASWTPLGTVRQWLFPGEGAASPPFADEALLMRLARYDVGEEQAWLAWEIVRSAPDLDEQEQRGLLLLVLALQIGWRQGSTHLAIAGERGGAFRDLVDELGGPGAHAAASALLVSPRARVVIGAPGEAKPLICQEGRLFSQRLLHFEQRVGAALAERLARPPFAFDEAALARALAEVAAQPAHPLDRARVLSAEQQYAVLSALIAPLWVVTGGPGTGKTSIVVSLLRLWVRLGLPAQAVALAAPTGRAAQRMQESIMRALASLPAPDAADRRLLEVPGARTLHRLLGYAPGRDRFGHHEHNRLGEALVIVDECSMIDLVLMDQLLRATRDDARLVLLGDAAQLPSVEAGAVFRDLVGALRPGMGEPPGARSAPVVRLQHSYRFDDGHAGGRQIGAVAAAIQAGDVAALAAGAGPAAIPLRAGAAELVGEGIELLPASAPSELEVFLDHWFAEQVCGLADFDERVRRRYRQSRTGLEREDQEAALALLAHFEGHRLLCVTRRAGGWTGSDACNQRLGERHRQRLRLRRGPGLFPGQPVLMLRNDYQRSLWNGDQGLVLRIVQVDGGEALAAVFRRSAGELAVFPLAGLGEDLAPAYATTVHRAQGCEFDRVALVLPPEPLPMLTREVVYTALTRARRSAVIIGGRDCLADAVGRQQPRWSTLGDQLASIRSSGR
jgi:exodeoxyribonuclease V alpha subunit